MKKELYCLGYTNTNNLGDEIQSWATIHLLKRLGIKLGGFVDRDKPRVSGKTNLLVNGYIPIRSLDNLLDQSKINPIFSNLHLALVDQGDINATCKNLASHSPIGCRDRWTADLLSKKGLQTFFNYCLSLTFEKRKKPPVKGKVLAVDIPRKLVLPRQVSVHGVEHVSHHENIIVSPKDRMKKARDLLELYRDKARLVITTRLHSALPCVAMGIPVIMILISSQELHRLRLAEEVIPVYRCNQLIWNIYLKHQVDWDPPVLDIEDIKEKIISNTHEQIQLRL